MGFGTKIVNNNIIKRPFFITDASRMIIGTSQTV
jgi:hypothetical protein